MKACNRESLKLFTIEDAIRAVEGPARRAIKANELRIGNLLYRDDVVVKVLLIDQEGATTEPIIATDIKGAYNSRLRFIPLTEEWFLRFGFEKKIEPTVGPIWDEDISYHYEGYRFSQDVYDKWFLLGYSWNTKHINYVHQLQNLYFALAGEELEFENNEAI